ncbi:MAG: hypothetical protein HZA13_02535 [Nitrospirae bacterium]|nr:hypothetical protein [Nitrospirota bacterium]
MYTKTVKRGGESKDLLGLIAFGSLITNIFQLVSKRSLEKQHDALRAYVAELKRHYEIMKVRERQVYNENLELKRASEGLIAINNRLLGNLIEANIKLKSSKPATILRRRRAIPKTRGGPK